MHHSHTNPLSVETVISVNTEIQIAPDLFQPLTSVQLAAVDLYRRGLNVFPVPRPAEVKAWARITGKEPTSKPAYLLKPLFASRLHMCGPECYRNEQRGRACAVRFEPLFEHANVAAMCGRTSGNLAVLDCDSPKAYQTVGAELYARALPFWSYKSSKGGGYMLRIIEGEAANLPNGKTTIPDCEVWGHDHYVVLPPSVHHTGVIYQWDCIDPRADLPTGEPLPAVSIRELEFLGVQLVGKEGKAPELYGLPAWTIVLSESNRRILASTPENGTRNSQLTKVVYDLAAAENSGACTFEQVRQLLEAFCKRTNYQYSHALDMLKSAEHKRNLTGSKEYYGITAHKQDAASSARAFAAGFDWRSCGRTAQAERAVFLACCERSKLDNSDVFRASCREVAELANITPKTAAATLKRLCSPTNKRPALLKLVYSDENRMQASLYTFQIAQLTTVIHLNDSVVSCTPDFATQDVFNRRPAARRVWEYLTTNTGATKAEIARAMGLHHHTVGRSLAWLMEHSLVTYGKSEGLFYGEPKTASELERLAAVMGNYGKAEQRKRDNLSVREKRTSQLVQRARNGWADLYK